MEESSKDVPMIPTVKLRHGWLCPACGAVFKPESENHCFVCGQRIAWKQAVLADFRDMMKGVNQ